jgi:transcription elongation GreA/GreB family factor
VRLLTNDGETMWVRPVHPVEAFLDEERISSTSPLSVAILGRNEGDVVAVESPTGTWLAEIVAIEAGCVDITLRSSA